MKRYIVLMMGVFILVISFLWMLIEKASTGPFLLLAGIGGGVIEEGIQRLRGKR